MMLLITKQFRDGLLAYLASRPYREVAEAIGMLESLPPAPVVAQPPQVKQDGKV